VKEQLLGVLGWLSGEPLPVWTVDTADTLLRYGAIDDATRLLAIINLNPDEIDPLMLKMPGARIERIEALSRDGVWQEAEFTSDGNVITVEAEVRQFDSFIARVRLET